MDFSLQAGKLRFVISEDAQEIDWKAEGLPMKQSRSADFWRLFLDNGEMREITIRSSRQRGRVEQTSEGLFITYDELVSDFGDRYKVVLSIRIRPTAGTYDCLEWQAEVSNRTEASQRAEVRVNELQLPFLDFSVLCDGQRERDVYYKMNGLGERIENPWKQIMQQHTGYVSADYNQVWDSVTYPAKASMCWFGVESGGHFLYLGKQDSQVPVNVLSAGIGPVNSVPRLLLAISHFPLAKPGETVAVAHTVVSLNKGDWRTGSDIYGEFARKNWYRAPQRPQWVQEMTGWQRIILKHQYGEVFFTYQDLPDIYREQSRYGLTMLMVFGWWKGRFDNGYPLYEPDPALGGAGALTKAIDEIQQMGGRVALYTNGVLVDVKSAFYRQNGWKVSRKDLDGNEYREHYRFSNNGMLAREFGYKTFVSACQATAEWRDRLVENGKVKLSFQPDSIFFDQIGGHFPRLCFDETHQHGPRGDREQEWRIKNLKALRSLCNEEQAIGSEFTVDAYAPYLDYHHGCMFGNTYRETNTLFPELFLRTFPETIQTDRFLHDDREGFEKALNYAFLYGFRFDVSIYRGRKSTVGSLPAYAAYLKKLIECKETYHRFFYHGRFVVKTELSLPEGVKVAEYEHGDEVMFALWNHSTGPQSFSVFGRLVSLAAEEVCCIMLKRDETVSK